MRSPPFINLEATLFAKATKRHYRQAGLIKRTACLVCLIPVSDSHRDLNTVALII